jgi:hypothetical protein
MRQCGEAMMADRMSFRLLSSDVMKVEKIKIKSLLTSAGSLCVVQLGLEVGGMR